MEKFVEPDWVRLEERMITEGEVEYYVLREFPCEHGCGKRLRNQSRVLRLNPSEMSEWISTIEDWWRLVSGPVTCLYSLLFVLLLLGSLATAGIFTALVMSGRISPDLEWWVFAGSFIGIALSVFVYRKGHAYQRRIYEALRKKRLDILTRHGIAEEDGWGHAIPCDEWHGSYVIMPEKNK